MDPIERPGAQSRLHALLFCLVYGLQVDAVLAGPDRAGPALLGDQPPADVVDVEGEQGQVGRPDLMLAESYEGDVALAGYWVSEKLDGVRAYWDGERLITRGGQLIRAPKWFTAGFPRQPLDGELWMGRGEFERVSGLARRLEPDPAEWRSARYMVFDLASQDAPFGRRLQALQKLVATASSPYLATVEQFRVGDEVELNDRLRRVEAAGGEGLMLHHADARYLGGRTSALLKVKSFKDAEARVLAHIPGRGRLEGMLGALLVEDDEGRRFRIGTGFSDAERRDPPPIGSLVTFKYQGRTERGIPRFASFLRVRAGE